MASSLSIDSSTALYWFDTSLNLDGLKPKMAKLPANSTDMPTVRCAVITNHNFIVVNLWWPKMFFVNMR